MKSYKFTIQGRVQGVYYRVNVQKMSQSVGFNGYVKNLSDGDVEAVVTLNDETVLDKFIEILKKGSPLSSVKEIKKSHTEEIHSNGFVIKYD